MGFLRKYLMRQEAVQSAEIPLWASFMKPVTFSQFVAQTEAEIRKKYPTAAINWDEGCWRPAAESELSLGLINLAQICNALNKRQWPSEIARFTSFPSTQRPDSKAIPYEEAKALLKVRMFPLDLVVDFLVTAPYCDSFRSVLVLDYPDYVASVANDCVEAWGVPLHELFKVGLDNVLKNDIPNIAAIGEPSRAQLTCFEGDSFFTATHALMLERHIEFDEISGLLVIVPNRHLLLCTRSSAATRPILQTLADMAQDLYAQGPGSITPEVLWLRRGQFQRLDVKGGVVQISDDLFRAMG